MIRIERRAEGLWPFIVALAVVGLLDLAFLRVAYRIGLFAPRDGPLADAYRVATSIGSLAFDLVSVLAIIVAASISARRWRTDPLVARGLAVLSALGVLGPFAPGDLSYLARALFAGAAAAAVVAAVGPAIRERRPLLERLALVLVSLTAVAAQYLIGSSAIATAWTGATPPPSAASGAWVTETAAVGAGSLLLAVALRERSAGPVQLLGAGLAALGVGAALTLQPYLAGIVVLWAAGLSLVLPVPFYVVALAAMVLAVLVELSSAEGRQRGVALVLLLVAGVMPQTTAHTIVAVLAVVLLSGARPVRVSPRPG